MQAEPEIHVENRETLVQLLSEAAEIEHGLMCCYLYASFSLGAPFQRSLPAEQASMVKRWQRVIAEIARDEMVHLALVSNAMNAVGATPHLRRPNFPVAPGYYPQGVVTFLAPFCLATLDHFIYLERPEGVELADGEGFRSHVSYQRGGRSDRLIPSAQDYTTVGHLYRGICAGFAHLGQRLGEAELFCGDPALQLGPPELSMPGLSKVTNLVSASAAVDTIVTQGEGSTHGHDQSHYHRLSRLRQELCDWLAREPDFLKPVQAVATNPVMRHPPVPDGLVWVNQEPAASLLDVTNATYLIMLRALELLFSPAARDPAVRPVVLEASLAAMRALPTAGELLTGLPANAELPGKRAGLSFTMSRGLGGSVETKSALHNLAELTHSVSKGFARHAESVDASLGKLAEQFGALGDTLHDLVERVGRGAPTAVAAPKPLSPPSEYQSGEIEQARGKSLVLRFEAKRCIHARHCVLGAPRVFLANVQGPWLFPDEASSESLLTIAHTCPSGAITYRRLDGGAEESAPPVNVTRVRENGPYAVHADLRLNGVGSLHRATLCRCGASANKPFCDGSHNAIAFQASGEPQTLPSEPLAERAGPLEIRPLANGPLEVSGNVELCAGTGRTVARLTTSRWCRCGGSRNKPFCDGTHSQNGFQAPGA
jgi:CDGSH-type Zn-finger protein/uncharacterized Fe-S cluster protein YjdI